MVKQASELELSMFEGHQLQGMTFLSNVFHKPFPEPTKGTRVYFNHHKIPIVYNIDPNNNFFVFHPPGKQDHLTLKILFFALCLTCYHMNNFLSHTE